MNEKKAKKFLSDIRKLNIKASLSPDKTFIIYTPPLALDKIQDAIDMTDVLCLILDTEDKLLSNDDAELIQSLVDNDEDIGHSSFRLTDVQTEDDSNLPIIYEEMTSDSFNQDFDYIRKNLKDIIKSGSSALNKMIIVAEASQHPRSYEVVATLIKALADVNKDLLDSHKRKVELNMISGTSTTTNNSQTNTSNTIFVGSTSELAKLLKNKIL